MNDGKNEGDCVETLYRHLINIAIQDPDDKRRNMFHIERLPKELRKYYNPSDECFTNRQHDLKEATGLKLDESEAGLTDFVKHISWKSCLIEALFAIIGKEDGCTLCKNTLLIKKISELWVSIGQIDCIANILHTIAFHNSNDKNIKTGTDRNASLIENAMNKLSALSETSSKRFDVKIKNKTQEMPQWVNKIIEINDPHAHRTIVVGAEKDGHAEIIKITPLQQ